MIELEIYNTKLDVLGIVTNWYSLRWRKMYYGIGEFELHAQASKENIELLKEGNLITRLDDEEVGIIKNIFLEQSETNGETIKVTGYFLNYLLESRIMLQTYTYNDTAENIFRDLVNKSLIKPTDKARRIDNIVLDKKVGFTDKIDIQIGLGKKVSTSIEKMCKVTNLSTTFYIDYDTKEIKFKVWKGRDLTDLVILSDRDGTIKNSKYDYVTTDYKSFTVVAGQGEGTARKKITLDDGSTGWNRQEFYVDARDISDTKVEEKEVTDEEGNTTIETTEKPLTEEEYNKLLVTRGREKMEDKIKHENFEAETTNSINDRYKKDWDLGDIVTVYKENWGKEIQERVLEVEETYENGIIKIYPIFGSPLPELKDILKDDDYYSN